MFNLLEVILTIDEPFVRKETIICIKLIVDQIGKVSELEKWSNVSSLVMNYMNEKEKLSDY